MRAQETYIPTKKKLLDKKMKKIGNSTSFYTEIQENLEILKLQKYRMAKSKIPETQKSVNPETQKSRNPETTELQNGKI